MWLTVLLCAVLVAQVASTQVACQCDTITNKRILQDFYTATEGPSEWSIAWNFNSQSLCELYGVNCTELNVTSLSIGPIGVAGTLPPSLSSLDALQTLVISYNSGLHGTIPPSYGNLVSLTTLSIVGCQLSGTIPGALKNLVNLRSLSLHSNSLTGSLSAVSNMRSLQSLDLSDNQLTGPIPSALSTTLSNINLAFNYDLQLNNDTVPLSFGSLRQLRTLTLSSTKFTDGTFPPALCSLVNLTSLDVSSSQLRGSIPLCLSSFANIESLNIGSNAFNATIPSFVYTLTRLTTLQCPACLLRGPIDRSIGLLTSLAILDLSHGILSGGIPDSIGQLTSLTYLSLSTNSLTGTLPSAIVNCSQLQHLEVQGNLLHGAVPKELGSLQYLSTCMLSNNMLSGTIPPIVNMTSLQVLKLDHNWLTGALPSTLPPQLTYLSLSGNNISGGLPQAWYKSSLTILDVSNNSLSGILPPVWGLKADWQQIVLGNNRLEGMLPASWSPMVGLLLLQLHSNDLSGPLPPQWGVGMRAASLSLGGNPRLCGGVPSSWTNRTNPIPSDAGSISNATCNATRFIATPPPRLSRRVTLQYCSIACDSAAPGYFPATPQTDEEIVAMTAVARNAYLTALKNASQAAGCFLLGGGMIPSDSTTLRWLGGALGDTDDGEGTIFYVEDMTFPSGLCVAPCALAKDFSVLQNDTLGQLLVLDIFSAHWVMMDASALPGAVGCMCQEGRKSERRSPQTTARRKLPQALTWTAPLTKTESIMPTETLFTQTASQTPTHLRASHSVTLPTAPKLPTPSPSDTTLLTSAAVLLSSSQSVAASTQPIVSMSRTLPGPELLAPVPAIQKAAEVVSSAAAIFSAPLSLLGGSAGAADGALLAVVLQVSCGTDSNRGKASVAWLRYLLSPFVDLGHFWMVVGNVLVVAGVWGAAEIASVVLPRITTGKATLIMSQHPSLALRLSGFLSVGVLFGSGRLISTTSMTAVDAASSSGVSLPAGVLAAVGAVGVLLTASVHVYALFLVARSVLPTAVEVRWGDASVSTLMPSTEWKPDALVATHGSLFTAYRAPLSLPVMAALLLLPMAFAGVSSGVFPDSACMAQLVIMLGLQIALAVLVLWRRPYMAPLAAPLAVLSSGSVVALLSVALYASAYGDRSDAVQSARSGLIVLNSLCSVLRPLYLVGIRIYQLRYARATVSPEAVVGGPCAKERHSKVEDVVSLESLLSSSAQAVSAVAIGPFVDTSQCCQRVRIHLPPHHTDSLRNMIIAICKRSPYTP